MPTATYYRIQPAGLPLVGHTSEDWSGDLLPDGRVCAFPSQDHVISGRGEDWFEHEAESLEIVAFTGTDPEWLASCSAGVSVTPVRELSRQPLVEWLDEMED